MNMYLYIISDFSSILGNLFRISPAYAEDYFINGVAMRGFARLNRDAAYCRIRHAPHPKPPEGPESSGSTIRSEREEGYPVSQKA